jgi:hypothetical protein
MPTWRSIPAVDRDDVRLVFRAFVGAATVTIKGVGARNCAHSPDLLVRPRQVARHDPLLALKLIYQMFSKLLSWIVLRTRSDATKEIEILVLRHQLAVLQRRTPQPRMTWTDRALIAALTRLLPVRRRLGLLVTPTAILRWHRQLVASRWTTTPARPGRLAIPAGLRALAVRLATENSAWVLTCVFLGRVRA